MKSYKLSPTINGFKNDTIICDDGTQFPKDPDNTDYQAYLKWIEEGNTPEEAE